MMKMRDGLFLLLWSVHLFASDNVRQRSVLQPAAEEVEEVAMERLAVEGANKQTDEEWRQCFRCFCMGGYFVCHTLFVFLDCCCDRRE